MRNYASVTILHPSRKLHTINTIYTFHRKIPAKKMFFSLEIKSVEYMIFTDLGSLFGNTHCGKYQNFSPTQILRTINFGHFVAPKPAILTI